MADKRKLRDEVQGHASPEGVSESVEAELRDTRHVADKSRQRGVGGRADTDVLPGPEGSGDTANGGSKPIHQSINYLRAARKRGLRNGQKGPSLQQRAWALYLKENMQEFIKAPHKTALAATFYAYDTEKPHSAIIMTNRNLNNPHVMRLLFANADQAESRMLELIQSDDEKVALQASTKVLEFVYGKPKEGVTPNMIEGEVVDEAAEKLAELEGFKPAQLEQGKPDKRTTPAND